jgi:hypothetical protein
MRTNTKCSMGNNLKMSNEVYALRREVMNHLYEAKNTLRANGIQMPRVDVRVTDNKGHDALGMGRLNGNIIWISLSSLKTWKAHLRDVVYHELVHAVTGFEHDDNCRLMCPCVNMKPLDKAEADTLLLKYFKK